MSMILTFILLVAAACGVYCAVRGFMVEPWDVVLEEEAVHLGRPGRPGGLAHPGQSRYPGRPAAGVATGRGAGAGTGAGTSAVGAGSSPGCRLLHLSDLHLRPGRRERAYQEKVLRMARQAKPDVIFLTGDYSDEPEMEKPLLRRFVGELSAIAPVLAVMGDNDLAYPDEVDEMEKALATGGARVLRNEKVTVTLPAPALSTPTLSAPSLSALTLSPPTPSPVRHLVVAGVDDSPAGRAEIKKVLSGPAVPAGPA
ncbi:MAG TPA: hypothetical protein GXX29_11755, partial [Firmicutes bacterium]|nr:hypothetical protein [Bacillota bacterium]